MSERKGTATVKYIDVDTGKADKALEQLQQHSEITKKSVMEVVSKSYQSLMLVADVMGIAIPEWFNIMASAVIMAGNMFVALATAESISGVMAAKAVVTFNIAALMFYRGMQINAARRETEGKLNSVLQLLHLYS